MMKGIASLRCPSCLRAFLSPPPDDGALLACPHCRHQATAGTFTPAAKDAPTHPRRIAILGHLDAPPPDPTPAWPTAPEQPQKPSGPSRMEIQALREALRPSSPLPKAIEPAPQTAPTQEISTNSPAPTPTPKEPRRFHPAAWLVWVFVLATLGGLIWLSLQPPLAIEFPLPTTPRPAVREVQNAMPNGL